MDSPIHASGSGHALFILPTNIDSKRNRVICSPIRPQLTEMPGGVTLSPDLHVLDRPLPSNDSPYRTDLAECEAETDLTEREAERVSTDGSRLERPTYLHPAVVAVAVAGYAWMLLAFWVAFAGYGYMSLAMFAATMISAIMIGSLIAGPSAAHNSTPWQRPWRSVKEFLDGEVQVWGARVRGRDAFVQLGGMAWCLALLATAFSVITAMSRP